MKQLNNEITKTKPQEPYPDISKDIDEEKDHLKRVILRLCEEAEEKEELEAEFPNDLLSNVLPLNSKDVHKSPQRRLSVLTSSSEELLDIYDASSMLPSLAETSLDQYQSPRSHINNHGLEESTYYFQKNLNRQPYSSSHNLNSPHEASEHSSNGDKPESSNYRASYYTARGRGQNNKRREPRAAHSDRTKNFHQKEPENLTHDKRGYFQTQFFF